MWSAVGHIGMNVVQHGALPEHARMYCFNDSMEISEGSTELRCIDTGDSPSGCQSSKGQ